MATIIRTVTELQAISGDLTADYELANDIDCTGVAFNPLGGWGGANDFTGTFDGKGRTIRNLSVAKNGANEVGLFGTIDGATIQNVTLESPAVAGDDYTGALVGLTINTTSIINCHVIGGSVTGNDHVGGLIGYASGTGTITISHSTCTVTSDAGAAGINNNIGGFIGYSSGVDIDYCYATGVVTGIGEKVGGFIGNAISGAIDQCYATGAVSTGDNAGDSYCGGFMGWGNTDDTNCYATGSVTATGDYVGGYAGVSPSTQTNCYSTGAVAGVGANVGGFNGNLGGTVTACFWDTETSGQAASAGGTGKTTEQMKSFDTFQNAGWAISRIWNILSSCNNGYPCLVAVNPCCSVQQNADKTIAEPKVTLEIIRNLEIVSGSRFFIDKSGNAKYESRYFRYG